MIDGGTIVAVAVGGALSLLGTVLANYLQYCREREHRKKDRMRERMRSGRRWGYLVGEGCLRLEG